MELSIGERRERATKIAQSLKRRILNLLTMNLLTNKRATHDYEIKERFEAGISLHGWEVKSLRQKHGSLSESYVTVKRNERGTPELFLKKAHIPHYQPNQISENGDPYRERKLLLKKKEIAHIAEALKQKGVSVIPLRIYEKGNLMKVEIALAKGKKKHDKREDLKKRAIQREIQQKMKTLWRG